MVQTLLPTYAERVQKIEVIGADIKRLVWERSIEGALYSGKENRLESLLSAFVKMSALHQRLSRFVGNTTPSQLEQELLGLGQSLSARRTLRCVSCCNRRCRSPSAASRQQETLDNQLRLLGVRMGTLEMSLDYLRSHVFGGRSEQELSAEIEQLMSNLSYLVEVESEVNTSVERLGPPPLPTMTRTQNLRNP